MPGPVPELDKAITRDAEGLDVAEPGLRDTGRRDGDQPGLPIDSAETLRDPVVPRHDFEGESALLEAHDVEARCPTRQVERDITRPVTTVGERRADFTKWSKCLGSELRDCNVIHLGHSSRGGSRGSHAISQQDSCQPLSGFLRTRRVASSFPLASRGPAKFDAGRTMPAARRIYCCPVVIAPLTLCGGFWPGSATRSMMSCSPAST